MLFDSDEYKITIQDNSPERLLKETYEILHAVFNAAILPNELKNRLKTNAIELRELIQPMNMAWNSERNRLFVEAQKKDGK